MKSDLADEAGDEGRMGERTGLRSSMTSDALKPAGDSSELMMACQRMTAFPRRESCRLQLQGTAIARPYTPLPDCEIRAGSVGYTAAGAVVLAVIARIDRGLKTVGDFPMCICNRRGTQNRSGR